MGRVPTTAPLSAPAAVLLPLCGALPIEAIVLPPNVDGSTGANRATGVRPQIAATNDVDAIKAWLARFIDTKTTFENYRKEAERLTHFRSD